MLGGRSIRTPSSRINRNGIFLTPKQLLIIPALRLSYTSLLLRNLLPNAIGFNSPTACFCHNVIPRAVLFDRLLRYYLYLLRNVLRPVFRLTFSLLFQNHFVVQFPLSILYLKKIS